MVESLTGVANPIFEKIAATCRKHGVALLFLFGSQAREGFKFLSGEPVSPNDSLTDLDVGVVTEESLPPPLERSKFYAGLYNELEDILQPFDLDLVLLEENHSVFQAEAVKGICVFQVNEAKRDAYEMMVLRRAADFRPYLERYLREALEEV